MHDKKLVSKSEACYSIHSSSDEDPVRIRFLICGDLRIPYLGLIYYCFLSEILSAKMRLSPHRQPLSITVKG